MLSGGYLMSMKYHQHYYLWEDGYPNQQWYWARVYTQKEVTVSRKTRKGWVTERRNVRRLVRLKLKTKQLLHRSAVRVSESYIPYDRLTAVTVTDSYLGPFAAPLVTNTAVARVIDDDGRLVSRQRNFKRWCVNRQFKTRLLQHAVTISPYTRDRTTTLLSPRGYNATFGFKYDTSDPVTMTSREFTFTDIGPYNLMYGNEGNPAPEDPPLELYPSGARWTVRSFDPSGTDAEDMITEALQKAIMAMQDRVNVFTTLGELPETIRLLRDIVVGCKRVSRKALTWASEFLSVTAQMDVVSKKLLATSSNRRKKRLLKTAEYLRTRWLGLRYGLRPLVYEMEGYLERFTASDNYLPLRTEAMVVRDTESTVPGASGLFPDNLLPWRAIEYDLSMQRRVVTHAVVYWASRPPDNPKADPLIHITDLIEASWDLIPYSFVADWFLTFGNWLRTLAVTIKVQPKRMSVTQRWDERRSALPTGLKSFSEIFAGTVPESAYATPQSWSIPEDGNIPITIRHDGALRYDDPEFDATSLDLAFRLRLDAAKITDLLALGAKFLSLRR